MLDRNTEVVVRKYQGRTVVRVVFSEGLYTSLKNDLIFSSLQVWRGQLFELYLTYIFCQYLQCYMYTV